MLTQTHIGWTSDREYQAVVAIYPRQPTSPKGVHAASHRSRACWQAPAAAVGAYDIEGVNNLVHDSIHSNPWIRSERYIARRDQVGLVQLHICWLLQTWATSYKVGLVVSWRFKVTWVFGVWATARGLKVSGLGFLASVLLGFGMVGI